MVINNKWSALINPKPQRAKTLSGALRLFAMRIFQISDYVIIGGG